MQNTDLAFFSQADSIYQGIGDHFPMAIFIFCYLIVTLCVCFYIQWDVTLVAFLLKCLILKNIRTGHVDRSTPSYWNTIDI